MKTVNMADRHSLFSCLYSEPRRYLCTLCTLVHPLVAAGWAGQPGSVSVAGDQGQGSGKIQKNKIKKLSFYKFA